MPDAQCIHRLHLAVMCSWSTVLFWYLHVRPFIQPELTLNPLLDLVLPIFTKQADTTCDVHSFMVLTACYVSLFSYSTALTPRLKHIAPRAAVLYHSQYQALDFQPGPGRALHRCSECMPPHPCCVSLRLYCSNLVAFTANHPVCQTTLPCLPLLLLHCLRLSEQDTPD